MFGANSRRARTSNLLDFYGGVGLRVLPFSEKRGLFSLTVWPLSSESQTKYGVHVGAVREPPLPLLVVIALKLAYYANLSAGIGAVRELPLLILLILNPRFLIIEQRESYLILVPSGNGGQFSCI